MSYADELVEHYSDPDPFRRRRGKYRPAPPKVKDADRIWTMIDGETIRFGDMTPSHRGNCVRMLIGRHGKTVAEESATVQAMRRLGIE